MSGTTVKAKANETMKVGIELKRLEHFLLIVSGTPSFPNDATV
jgi:hypothetical protein